MWVERIALVVGSAGCLVAILGIGQSIRNKLKKSGARSAAPDPASAAPAASSTEGE